MNSFTVKWVTTVIVLVVVVVLVALIATCSLSGDSAEKWNGELDEHNVTVHGAAIGRYSPNRDGYGTDRSGKARPKWPGN